MTETMSQIAQNIFGNNAALATIFMAIIPLVELKGSIPFGMSEDIWGKVYMLNAWQAFLWSILAEIVVTAILAYIFKPIYNAIKDKKFFRGFVHFLTDSLNEKNDNLEKASSKDSENKKFWKKFATVFTFTALPIPGTGVYTGTILSILMGLGRHVTILCVTLGNIVAGVIIMTICHLFPEITTILLYIFLVLIVLALIYKIAVHIIKSKRRQLDKNWYGKTVSEKVLWDVIYDTSPFDLQATNNIELKEAISSTDIIFDSKQKLTIIKLHIKGCKVMYYDEITSIIDDQTKENIKTTLDNLAGKIVVVVTNRTTVVLDCDRIMLLNNGNIIAQKSHTDIFACPLDWDEMFGKASDKSSKKEPAKQKEDNKQPTPRKEKSKETNVEKEATNTTQKANDKKTTDNK